MKYPAVRIEFKDFPDFVCEKQYYDNAGGFSGMCRELHVPFKAVKKVHHELLSSNQFPTKEWEP